MTYDDERRFDIAPVLEHYGWDVYNEGPGWRKIRCQSGDHSDRNPSCSINYDIGRIKCFGCDFRGDAISVVRHYEEGITYADAVKRCEEITGGSDGALRSTSSSRGSVPRRQRDNSERRIYTPPWVRGRTIGRT